MNFKTTTILIALLAITLGLVWWNQREAKPAPQVTEDNSTPGAAGPRLLDVVTDQLSRVTITNPDGTRTALQRNNQSWSITSPFNSPAVDWQVSSLMSSIAGIRSQGRPSSTPADAGLSRPRYTISLESVDGKTAVVKLGNKTGVGDEMYCTVDGGAPGSSDVNLVDASIEKTLKTAADDVRDKHLLTLHDSDVKQFKITQGKNTISGKQIGSKWDITDSTSTVPGDTTAISTFLSGISAIEGTSFLKSDDPTASFAGFERPTAMVWLSTEAPSTQPDAATTNPSGVKLTIGAPDSLVKDHYFAQVSDGPIAKIASTSLDALKKTQIDLRDRDVLSIPQGDANKIVLTKKMFQPMPATTGPAASAPSEPVVVATNTTTLEKAAPPPPQPLGPSLPTSGPSTQATTEATTIPSAPEAQWHFAVNNAGPADDAKVITLLGKLQPLHADSYRATPPAASAEYDLDIYTPSAMQHIVFERPSTGTGAIGKYNDLTFDVPQAVLDALDADFHPTPPATAPSK